MFSIKRFQRVMCACNLMIVHLFHAFVWDFSFSFAFIRFGFIVCVCVYVICFSIFIPCYSVAYVWSLAFIIIIFDNKKTTAASTFSSTIQLMRNEYEISLAREKKNNELLEKRHSCRVFINYIGRFVAQFYCCYFFATNNFLKIFRKF